MNPVDDCFILAVRTGMRIKFHWETDGNTSDGQSVNSDVSMRTPVLINKEFLAIRWAISVNKTFVLFC